VVEKYAAKLRGRPGATKGRKASSETRGKQSLARVGFIFSEDDRQNISGGNSGRTFS